MLLSLCFASSSEQEGMGVGVREALMLAFHILALGKGGQTHPGKEGPYLVPFHVISRSESGKQQRLVGEIGAPSGGRDAAHAEK